jgi:hypothetical protein
LKALAARTALEGNLELFDALNNCRHLRAPSPTHGGTPIVSGSVSTAFGRAAKS